MIKSLLCLVFFMQCAANPMNEIHVLIDKFNKKWGVPTQIIVAPVPPVTYRSIIKEKRRKLITIKEEKIE